MGTDKEYGVDEIGILKLDKQPRNEISAGNVGYLISGIKVAREVHVGDTITNAINPGESLKGYEQVKPMVFAGIYPVDTTEFEELRASMEKLQLNDASLVWELKHLRHLGFGFRCGFLGMLHMEIIQERLEREFNMTVITTVPSVQFKAYLNGWFTVDINAPSEMPDPTRMKCIEEPYIKAQIISKSEYIGPIIGLCMDKRGMIKNQHYLTTDRVEIII